MSAKDFDVIVIGEGMSGLTAAAWLVQQGLLVSTFEQTLFGGLVLNINQLRPGLDRNTGSGADLSALLMEKNFEAGVISVQEPVTQIEQDAIGFNVVTPSRSYSARQVLLACGARLKILGVPGEDQFLGRGVSHCANCDGPMYVGMPVVVVGGGDSALQEALVLTEFARKVLLIHRGDKFRARLEFKNEVLANPKIQVIWNANVTAIVGDKSVRHVRIMHAGGRSEELACAGIFAYVGLRPNTENLPKAIWAIGAVRHGYAGQLSDAVAEAVIVSSAISERLSGYPA